MELREPIEWINEKLIKEFGKAFNGQPNFRVVFSEDQYEKRYTNYTDEGFALLHPQVRLLPKYKQWIHERYILERLIPIVGETDLTDNLSYEPAWVFQGSKGEYLPPWFDGCKIIIESIHNAAGSASGFAKYKDSEISPDVRKQKLELMEKELFGNETEVGDALAYDSGVVAGKENADITAKRSM